MHLHYMNVDSDKARVEDNQKWWQSQDLSKTACNSPNGTSCHLLDRIPCEWQMTSNASFQAVIKWIFLRVGIYFYALVHI